MTRKKPWPVFAMKSYRGKPTSNITVYAFYADLLYEEYPILTHEELLALPDGVYLFADLGGKNWFRKDLTPVLDEDVPSTLKMLIMLLR